MTDLQTISESAINTEQRQRQIIKASAVNNNEIISNTGVNQKNVVRVQGAIVIENSDIDEGVRSGVTTGSATEQAGSTVDQVTEAKQAAKAKAEAVAKQLMALKQKMDAEAKNKSKFVNDQTAKAEGSQTMITENAKNIGLFVLAALVIGGGIYWYTTKNKNNQYPQQYPQQYTYPQQYPARMRMFDWGRVFNK